MAGLTGVLLAAAPSAADAAGTATGTVAGRVFEDYNANGALDAGSNTAASASATDVGVAGADVTVTDSTGTSVGTATSTVDGTYSVSVTAATTTAVRVEITPPPGYHAGAHGPDSGSTVQFVTLGTAAAGTVDVALSRIGDYSQPNPRILDVEQVSAINSSANSHGLIDRSTKPSLVSSAYSDRGTTATTTEATDDQTGTVWGVAQLGTDYAFTAASFRRHAPVGPGGLGAIYLTDLASGPNATPCVTIPDAGTNPRTDESSYTFDDWFHDTDAYPQVGKIGLGGVSMAPDHQSLYVVNLSDKQLYRVPFTQTGNDAPVAGDPVAIPLPIDLPGAGAGFGCDPSDVRPYGVDSQNGAVWVTLTCTGPDPSDLHGYIYRYDLSSQSFDGAPAFETDLSGYNRGYAYIACGSACAATWHVWPSTDTTFPNPNPGSNQSTAHPEPLVSSVAFDSNGDMSIGVKDRFADQVGYEAGNLTAGNNSTYEGFSAGDILRACGDLSSGWTLEHNGTCGSRTGSGPGNNQGPGGGEFYNDDYTGNHNQVALGSLLQLPGYGQVVSTAFDPGTVVRTSGVRFFNNTNGSIGDYHQLVAQTSNNGTGAQGSFSKAGGLGAIAALVSDAPVEIGNRVWLDSNYNGTQDAGEPSLAGVTVDLYTDSGTTPLATAVTDSDGNYYFSSAPGTSTASAIYGLGTLTPGTDYKVKLDHSADYDTGGPLDGYSTTTTAAGDDRAVDSNGATVAGVDQAAVTTGAAGVDDHTIDFGFVPQTYAVGDFVWKDSDGDGIQDAGEAGVANATVTLLNADGSAAHHPDGTLVAPVQTDNAGHYSFDFLSAGDYRASFTTLPTGYVLTTQSATGSTAADDSNPVPATGLTPVFSIGASSPNMRPVAPGDGVTTAVAIKPDDRAGLVPSPSVSVGDFVWDDTNHNGVQDLGEPGVIGVSVTLTGPGGGPVTDIFGNPVGAKTTGGNGGYLFTNLPPLSAGESYTAHVDNTQVSLTGYVPTETGQGTPSTDSSTDHASSGDLTTGGSSDLTLDFGFVTPAYAVGDFVWKDSDGDGIQDAGEPGVSGVTVTLFNADGSAAVHADGSPVASVQTDSAGHYSFDFLAAGDYRVGFTTFPMGYGLTTQSATGSTAADDSNPVPATGLTPTFSLGASAPNMRPVAPGDDVTIAAAINPTIDAGLVASASVSVGDFVWNDSNHNGVQNAGEPGINGVTVTLTGPGGGPVTDVFGNPVGATRTAGDGGYLFTDLPPLPAGESYTTHVDNNQAALTGYVPTLTGQGTPGTDSSTGHASSGELSTGGSSDRTLDFGFVKPVTVGDYVWVDKNHNGMQNKGESGIPGVVVTITTPFGLPVMDLHGDLVGSQLTGPHGKYEFTDLPPGQYVVHIDNSQPALSGYSATDAGQGGDRARDSSTGSSTSSSLVAGGSDQTLDFGFVTTEGTDHTGDHHGDNNHNPGHPQGNGNGNDSDNDHGGLSDTGAPVQLLLLIALVMLGAGAALSLAARSRRVRTPRGRHAAVRT